MEEAIRKVNPFFSQIPFKQISGSELEKKQKTETIESRICNNYKSFNDVKNQIINDINKLDCFICKNQENTKTAFSALSPVIPLRRISSVPDNIENGDYARAAGLVAIAGVMLPEDVRDMKDAWNQIVHKKLPNYDYKNSQAPFRFIRGTYAESPVNKLGKYGYYAHECDKSFAETNFGKKLKQLLNVSLGKPEYTGRDVPRVFKIADEYIIIPEQIYAEKLKGPFLGKLLYRAMQRTTVIGAVILSALWIPSIIKAFNKTADLNDKFINTGKQTLKASVNVTSVLAGIGILGALGARKGPAGSVIGMGIGAVTGSFISKTISEKI